MTGVLSFAPAAGTGAGLLGGKGAGLAAMRGQKFVNDLLRSWTVARECGVASGPI